MLFFFFFTDLCSADLSSASLSTGGRINLIKHLQSEGAFIYPGQIFVKSSSDHALKH